MLLPFLSLIAMKLVIHRKKIKEVIVNFKCRRPTREDEIPLIDPAAQPENDTGAQFIELIVDDDMRRNAFIVDV